MTHQTTFAHAAFAAKTKLTRIDLAAGGVPDATTLLHFHHLLETHDLCQGLCAASNAALTSAPRCRSAASAR